MPHNHARGDRHQTCWAAPFQTPQNAAAVILVFGGHVDEVIAGNALSILVLSSGSSWTAGQLLSRCMSSQEENDDRSSHRLGSILVWICKAETLPGSGLSAVQGMCFLCKRVSAPILQWSMHAALGSSYQGTSAVQCRVWRNTGLS